jgi:hypothetical protein
MHSLIRGSIGSTASTPSRNLAGGSTNSTSAELGSTGTTSTGLYDLWLNSMLPAVGPSMVTGVTSSSSHQINSERLAQKLMQLSLSETSRGVAGERI